ncbi:unnamed protein product, partial [Discosporangium mesarthrocarpum]
MVEENALLPPQERLSEEDLIIDPEYQETLERQGRELCEQVVKELEYSRERADRRLAKLRRRFTDRVETELITMRALQWDYEVSTFRVEAISPSLQAMLEKVHNQIREEEINGGSGGDEVSEGAAATSTSPEGVGEVEKVEVGMGNRSGPAVGGLGGGRAGRAGGALQPAKMSTFEARRAERHRRQAALEALVQAKPGKDVDDPRDVAAISQAESNMGDYKLKSAPDYEVPEAMQLNVEKKEREMVLLEESVHSMKTRFNKHFLALRGIKRDIMACVAKDNCRLAEIQRELEGGGGHGGEDHQLRLPPLDPSEWPETRCRVTESELKAYASKVAAAGDEGGGGGGGGPPLSAPPRDPITLADLDMVGCGEAFSDTTGGTESPGAGTTTLASSCSLSNDKATEQATGSKSEAGGGGVPTQEESLNLVVDVEGLVGQLPAATGAHRKTEGEPSALEEEERTAKDMLLRHERTTLLEKTAENVLAFDEAVYDLRGERMLTAANLKAAELKLLVLKQAGQELELLHQFDTKDVALVEKQKKKNVDKKEVVSAINSCRSKLVAKQAEAEVWQGKEAEVAAEFFNLVPEMNVFHSALLKVFRKKIKRAKKRLGGEEEGEEDSEEEEDDDEEYDFDDDEEEDVDDTCPPGCDIDLYEKASWSVLELRERRLDREEALTEIQKGADELKRTLDRQA